MSKPQHAYDWEALAPKEPPTVENIEREFRMALFNTQFYGISLSEVNQDTAKAEASKTTLSVLVQFGLRAGLIKPEEAEDWHKAIRGELSYAEVSLKYDKDEIEENLR